MGVKALRGICLALFLLLFLSILSGAQAQESNWTEMIPSVAPTERHEHNLAYDAESDRIVLFGGLMDGPDSDETWAYTLDTNTWTLMNPATSPSPRLMHAMAYDAESDRVILFGGIFKPEPETWTYDFNSDTWTNVTPDIQPVGYVNSRMVYDSESDRIILFGGDTENTVIHGHHTDETWSYDFNARTWSRMNPSKVPAARVLHGMAYDSSSDRVILFGGGVGLFENLGDTWAYDFNSDMWEEMNPPEAPGVRHGHGMGYDELSDRVVLFGGLGGSAETWVYDYDTNTWSRTETGTGPPRRRTPNLVYDSESERMIMFGGVFPNSVDQFYGDTWVYQVSLPEELGVPPWLWIAIGVAAIVAVAVVVLLLWRRRSR